MKTATKRPTITELVNKNELKESEVYLKLKNYMIKENNELYHYLLNKNELEDFLESRVESASSAFKSGLLANYPNPEELQYEVLFIGIENSVSEYVESMIDELPDFKRKLNDSSQYKDVLNDLIISSLPIFYSMITIPYSTCQEKLDNKLLRLIKRKSKTYKLNDSSKSTKTIKTPYYQYNERIHYTKKIDNNEFVETFIPF